MFNKLKVGLYKTDYLDDGKVLLSFANGKKFRVTPDLEIILRKFDGTRNINEIVDILNNEGINITIDELELLVSNKLSPLGIFNSDCKNEQLKLWYHLPLLNGEKIKFSCPSYTFNPIFIALFSIIYCIMVFSYFIRFKLDIFISSLISVNYFLFFILAILLFIVHELGHIAASKVFGCKIGNIGIGIYMFRPVIYVNLSDSWKLDNKKRLIIDFSGIYFQIIAGIFIYLIPSIYTSSTTIDALFMFNLFLILFNLNPFLRLDGYWILSDWLDEPNIHSKSINLVNEFLYMIKYGNVRIYSTKISKYVFIYSLIYILLNLSLISFGIVRVIWIVFKKKSLLQSIRLFMLGNLTSRQRVEVGTNLILDMLSIIYVTFLFVKIIKNYKGSNNIR